MRASCFATTSGINARYRPQAEGEATGASPRHRRCASETGSILCCCHQLCSSPWSCKMQAAEGHGEGIAGPKAETAWLQEFEVMGMRRQPTADETRLLRNAAQMRPSRQIRV
jgi:hypothetical protein